MKKGKIIPNGVSLQKHENDTVVFFTNKGYNIELIPPSSRPGSRVKKLKVVTKKGELIDRSK